MNDRRHDEWNWSNRIENLVPETYNWRVLVSEVGHEDLPDHQARRSTVVKVVAETAGIPDSAAEEVVGHALHNELLEETEDGTIVYVPENPGRELGGSHE